MVERIEKPSGRKPDKLSAKRTRARPPSLGRLVVFAIVILLLCWILARTDHSQIPLLEAGQPRTALILTAHPDDEVMFFTPTILGLIASGWEVSALCLSTGWSLSHLRTVSFSEHEKHMLMG